MSSIMLKAQSLRENFSMPPKMVHTNPPTPNIEKSKHSIISVNIPSPPPVQIIYLTDASRDSSYSA